MNLKSMLPQKIVDLYTLQSLKGRFIRGTFWAMVGTAIQQMMGMVSSVVVARLLGKAGFGELEMLQSTLTTFGIFAGFGLGLTATKYVAQCRDDEKDRTGRIIGMSSAIAAFSGGLMTVILLVMAPFLAAQTLNAPHLTFDLQIAGCMLFFMAIDGAQRGTLAGFEAFRSIATTALLQGIVQMIAVIIGVCFWGLRGAIVGYVIGCALGCIINRVWILKHMRLMQIPVVFRGMWEELPVLWSFSIPAFLSNLLVGPTMWAAKAFLVNQPSGFAEMGVYSAAIRFQLILSFVGSTVGRTLLPMMSSKGADTNERFQRSNIIISWLIGVACALPFICFPEVIGLVFGADYAGINAKRTLVLVMCYACVMLYKQGLARVLISKSMMWWGMFSNFQWAATLIGVAWYMTRLGAVGMAGAILFSYAFNTILFIPLYTRKNLVPKGTIVSAEALTIWAVIIVLACLSFFDVALQYRVLSLLVGIYILYRSFLGLYRSSREIVKEL